MMADFLPPGADPDADDFLHPDVPHSNVSTDPTTSNQHDQDPPFASLSIKDDVPPPFSSSSSSSSLSPPFDPDATFDTERMSTISRRKFINKNEYAAILAHHINSEMAINASMIAAWNTRVRMVFQNIPRSQDRAFIAYMQLPEDTQHRLSKGTRMKIDFDEINERNELIQWPAKVINQDYGSYEYVTLIVHRPWDAQNSIFLGSVPDAHEFDGFGSALDTEIAIENATGVNVNVHIDNPDKVSGNLLQAVESFKSTSNSQERTEWNENIDTAILCHNFDELPAKDAFAAVRQEFAVVEEVMDLNEDQAQIIDAMQFAPAGLTIVNGPPGTGKSKILLEILKPFLRSQETHTVLVSTSSNSAVDAIAMNMDKQLTEMKKAGLVKKSKYGLRAYSKGTEAALSKSWANKRASAKQNARPPVWDNEDIIGNLSTSNAILVSIFKKSTHQTYHGIEDPRLAHPHLSIGLKMLEIAGVVLGDFTHPDKERFAKFRHLNQHKANGKEFNATQHLEFNRHTEDLWEYTVQNASFIVGTTTNMGSSYMLQKLVSHVRLIMIDEAAHQREDHLIPFFAARFTQLDAFVQVGDQYQLQPMVTTTYEQSRFSSQFRMSFMKRLIMATFPVYWLTVQHRMVPDIADLANKLTYKGLLTNADTTLLENREIAQSFRNWAAQAAQMDSNNFVIDISGGNANQTQTSSGSSRYNDLFIILMGTNLKSLLAVNKQATIAILTGYSAQKFRLLDMKRNLENHNVQGMDRVTIDTFDASQGQEYDYVFIDILVNRHEPRLGFQADGDRMNVAMTRARNGMIIFADLDAIRRCRPWNETFMGKFLRYIGASAFSMRKYDRLPNVNFYEPRG